MNNLNAMNRIFFLCSCAILGFGLLFEEDLRAQTTARVDSFYMPSLGRTKKISILLPSKYDLNTRYPVLYLLHGLTGAHDDWWTKTKLSEYVQNIPVIVVMPDGENSWYVNSAMEPNDRYEDYVVSDVSEYVQKLYSIDTARQAIAGLSMGGYGATMLGLRHPAKYRFVGSLSGAITVPRGMNDTTRPAERSQYPASSGHSERSPTSPKMGTIFFNCTVKPQRIRSRMSTWRSAHRMCTDRFFPLIVPLPIFSGRMEPRTNIMRPGSPQLAVPGIKRFSLF